MNNKGFAITGIMYTLLLLFVAILVGMITMLATRKSILDNMRNDILDKIDNRFREVTWNVSFGGTTHDYFTSVVETTDGNVAVGASYSNDVDLVGLNHGIFDAIIVKYSVAGNVIWKKNFGGSGHDYFTSVANTSDGGFVAVGYSESSDVDLSTFNNGGRDAIIVKFDSLGNVVWRDNFGGTLTDSFAFVLVTDDGMIYAGGESNSTNVDLATYNKGGIDAVFVKYDAAGTRLWNKNFGGTGIDRFSGGDFYYNSPSSVIFYIVGSSGSTDVDLATMNKGGEDATLVKYDQNGTVSSKYTYGGTGNDTFSSTAYISYDNIVLAGKSSSIDGDFTNLNRGGTDAIVMGVTQYGVIIRKKNFGGTGDDQFNAISLTAKNEVLAVGTSSSADGNLVGLNYGTEDAMIVKYSAALIPAWTNHYGGLDWDRFYAVHANQSGGYVAVGESESVDNDLLGITKGYFDATIVRFDTTGGFN